MKIRTISYNLPAEVTENVLDKIGRCACAWNSQDFFVRTQRCTFTPCTNVFAPEDFDDIAAFCNRVGVRWFNVPIDPWAAEGRKQWPIAELLRRHTGAFCNVICTKDKKMREDILSLAADTFREAGEINESGNANFRFGASMNVSPNGPFFPFTYSDGKELSFSIGLELAEDINRIVRQNQGVDLCKLRNVILAELESQISEVEEIAFKISEEIGIAFCGIDFSLAPLPEDGSSVITILNELGISDINNVGMMFGTAFFTDILKYFASRHKSVGFSGVMYSLLEDKEYAEINDRHGFSLDKMISLSTMCGCGVDMVPIERGVADTLIKTILMEVGCISSRLSKPLGVRLLPMECGADQRTHIDEDQDFIVNTNIVPVKANEIRPFGNSFTFLRESIKRC